MPGRDKRRSAGPPLRMPSILEERICVSPTAARRRYHAWNNGAFGFIGRAVNRADEIDDVPRRRVAPPGEESLVTILASVSSWDDPVRDQGERGNDPH